MQISHGSSDVVRICTVSEYGCECCACIFPDLKINISDLKINIFALLSVQGVEQFVSRVKSRKFVKSAERTWNNFRCRFEGAAHLSREYSRED